MPYSLAFYFCCPSWLYYLRNHATKYRCLQKPRAPTTCSPYFIFYCVLSLPPPYRYTHPSFLDKISIEKFQVRCENSNFEISITPFSVYASRRLMQRWVPYLFVSFYWCKIHTESPLIDNCGCNSAVVPFSFIKMADENICVDTSSTSNPGVYISNYCKSIVTLNIEYILKKVVVNFSVVPI